MLKSAAINELEARRRAAVLSSQGQRQLQRWDTRRFLLPQLPTAAAVERMMEGATAHKQAAPSLRGEAEL